MTTPSKRELVESVIDTLVKQTEVLGDSQAFKTQAVVKILTIFGAVDDADLPF